MQIKHIQISNSSELDQIVKLHLQVLNESFLNNFGADFLKICYKTILADPNNINFIVEENGKIIAFLIATKDYNKFKVNVIKKNLFRIFFLLFLKFARNPSLALKLADSITFHRKKRTINSELQFIAVDSAFQKKGLGRKLIKNLNSTFGKNNILSYLVGTKANNKNSNVFYKKLNFRLSHSEKIFGDEFNYYISPKYTQI